MNKIQLFPNKNGALSKTKAASQGIPYEQHSFCGPLLQTYKGWVSRKKKSGYFKIVFFLYNMKFFCSSLVLLFPMPLTSKYKFEWRVKFSKITLNWHTVLQHNLRSHQAKGAAWQPAQLFSCVSWVSPSRQTMAQEGSRRMCRVSGCHR